MAEQNKVGFKKHTVIMGVIVSVWICLTLFVLGLFKIQEGWPAFLVLIAYFVSGAQVKNLVNISVGGVVGFLLTLLATSIIPKLVPNLGLEPAILTVVFLVLFINIILGDILPVAFNPYGLLYFTVAIAFPKQNTLEWIITLVLGGAFMMGGLLLTEKLVLGKLVGHDSASVKQ